MYKRTVGLALAAFVSLGMLTLAVAQPQIESDTHRVKVVNEMGHRIRLKIIGYQGDAYLSADLDDEDHVTRDFYAGERVICVWNHSKRVKMAVMVKFDRDGTLRLRPPQDDDVTVRAIESGN